MAEVTYYSLEEISKNDGRNGNKCWIIVKESVYDVTDYLDEHPGGGELITEWGGKDSTRAFDDAGHSGDAKKDLKKFKIGEVQEEDRKNPKKKTTTAKVVEAGPEKQDRRSFCSYLTCGLCA